MSVGLLKENPKPLAFNLLVMFPVRERDRECNLFRYEEIIMFAEADICGIC